MATRVPKTGASGGLEFAQGSEPLHISELDADLDALFIAGITNSNVAIGANIATSKLAADAGITSAMLGVGAVMTSNLANQPNGVTSGKLNINATTPAFSSAQVSLDVSVANTTTTLVTLPSMTTRGGRVLLFGTVSGRWHIDSSLSQASWVLLRDGVARATWNQGNLVSPITTNTSATTLELPGQFSPIFVDLTASAAAHVYALQLTVTSNVAGAVFRTDATQPGFLFALELA